MTLGRTLSRRLTLAALCGFLAVSFGAVAAKHQTAPPHIQVESLAALPAVSASAQRYRVGLLVDNQNTEPLLMGELRFTLRIIGQMPCGVDPDRVAIPSVDVLIKRK